MPVETHCPYENKSQGKRRRGIAQQSLSSLHGAKTFHVNHNKGNQFHSSGVENNEKPRGMSSGVIGNSGGATAEDSSIPNHSPTASAMTSSTSASKSITPSKCFRIRRRRRKRKESTEKEEDCTDKTQQQEDKTTQDLDLSNNRDCTRNNSFSFSAILPESNSIAVDADSNEPPSLNMTIAVASTDDNDAAGNAEVSMFELKEICSVEYFKATPLDEFRHRCRDSIKRSIQLSSRLSLLQPIPSISNECSSSHNEKPCELIQYDRLEIIRLLTNDIDWKSLCEHHDKREYKRHGHVANKSTRTALCEIVLAMTNPMVTPSCCQSRCLIEVLLNALIVSPSMSISSQKRRKIHHQKYSSTTDATNGMLRWTPSQQFLLESIRRLLLSGRISLDSQISDYVRNLVVFRPPFFSTEESGTNGRNTSTMSPNKVNRLLSAIYWLLSSSLLSQSLPQYWERALVSAGLLLLQRIDGWRIQIDAESQQQPVSDESNLSSNGCLSCNENSFGIQNGNRNRPHRHINRKMTVEALSNLHDEAIDIESKSTPKPYTYNLNKMFWRRSNQKQVSLKDVLAMKQSNDAGSNKNINSRNENRKVANVTKTTLISKDWSTVCSRAYKKFVSYSTERRQQQHLRELSSNDIIAPKKMMKQNSDEGFLWWLVSDAVLHQGSSSRRVCIALVAHSFGGPKNPFYFKFVARLFWQGYLQSSRQQDGSSSQWLRLYSEWLSDCAIFDQREAAWEAFQPIIQHVTACLISNEQEQVDLNEESRDSTTQKPRLNGDEPASRESYDWRNVCDKRTDQKNLDSSLMACLGYIIHRRSYLFCAHRVDADVFVEQCSIEKDFRSFINVLSIQFGESPGLWLNLFSDSTREMVESTLQRLGVLSFSVPDSGGEVDNNSPSSGTRSQYRSSCGISMVSVANSDWPFREEYSLRKAMGRIDRAVLSLENGRDTVKLLLSHRSTDSLIMNQETKIVRRSKKLMPSVPMTNYLHDNGILSLIFSYCGPKRLTKIPLVCKTWKAVSDTVSNSLWENAYVSNFGRYRWPCLDAEHRHRVSTCSIAAVDLDNLSKGAENLGKNYWKSLFAEKQIAEKMVRFQRNSRTGYKHRTCNYVGCLHILKTVEQERKHDQMHLRLLAKQQAALKKKKTSKKQKDKTGSQSSLRTKKG